MGYSRDYYKYHQEWHEKWEPSCSKEFFKLFHVDSVIDLGCGIGSFLLGFYQCGLRDLLGLEINHDLAEEFIDKSVKPYIIKMDITDDLQLGRRFDCVWSVEVAEHIHPDKTMQFIYNLFALSKRYVLLTAAGPGQRGVEHRNCRPREFWIEQIKAVGIEYMPDIENNIRRLWKDANVPEYILNNLMFFEKLED